MRREHLACLLLALLSACVTVGAPPQQDETLTDWSVMQSMLVDEGDATEAPTIRIKGFLRRPDDSQWQTVLRARTELDGDLSCSVDQDSPILLDHRSRGLSKGLPQLQRREFQEFDILVSVVRQPRNFHLGPCGHVCLVESRDAYLDLVRVIGPTGRFCRIRPQQPD